MRQWKRLLSRASVSFSYEATGTFRNLILSWESAKEPRPRPGLRVARPVIFVRAVDDGLFRQPEDLALA